jgi:hypothetical protein
MFIPEVENGSGALLRARDKPNSILFCLISAFMENILLRLFSIFNKISERCAPSGKGKTPIS